MTTLTDLISNYVPTYLLRSNNYYVVVTDLEGCYLFVNDLFRKRFRLPEDDLLYQSVFATIYQEDHRKCLEAVNACLAQPGKPVKIDLRKPDSTGESFYWTAWEFSTLQDPNQKPFAIICVGYDITETEKNSRIARDFAQKVEKIIEEINDGFYQLDNQWCFVKINKVAEKILGFPRERLLGSYFWDLFPDSPDYNYPQKFRKAMQEGIVVHFEDYRPDLKRWFGVTAYPSTEGLSVFFRDITLQKKYAERLKKQAFMLHAIYNSTTEASSFIDTDFIIRYNNHVARQITRRLFGKEAQIGDNMFDYVLPEYKEEFINHCQRVLKGETIVLERTDGERWWRFSLMPVYGERKEIIGIAHNVSDITEPKERELKLQESRHQLQRIIEAIPHPLLIVRINMLIEFVNEEFEKVFGYHAHEVLGKNIEILIPESLRENHKQYYKTYLEHHSTSMRIERYIPALTKSGKEIFVEASLNTFSTKNEQRIIVILQDVTAKKKYQDTILQQNKALQEIAWQQSHKIRSPLANILGLCNLLLNYPDEPEENKRVYVEYLNKAAKELDKVIHQIVNIANISDEIT
ncbi:MAG: PAS domain S-box protein [Cytophagales bacterium]|nr:PAS domain S-box protein [Bernardetiaceae bacterium]MDW8210912.1 PAS domain S-box protein [Cytophagales bacterium]